MTKTGSANRDLERAEGQEINKDDNAKSQDEKREFLDLHAVFACVGFGRHPGYSFGQAERFENGQTVAGTAVTCPKLCVADAPGIGWGQERNGFLTMSEGLVQCTFLASAH
jgi:hypothetical protein